PDFSEFDETGMPDAVLLTHAHTDHTGALPVLPNMLSADVKIYCTPATQAITRVLLEDSARRMERGEENDEALRYTLADVAAVLNRMKPVGWLEPIEVCPGVTATWIPAGHILGAAMLYIQGQHECILMTGDVSVSRQLTIPSLDLPSWCKPDVMVMESTYGGRQHEVSRKQEAKRLAADVAEVIAAGGKVLIPAFAVGRSQEVILILKNAMERKEIPEFLVYVDGMVRDVNAVYTQYADELQRPLRRKAEQDESLFYSDMIKKVESRDGRESILAGEPCCIVASSGMLNGGISNYYASKLVLNRKNLVAITGYQAEGTPGGALEELNKQEDSEKRVWFLADERFDVKCRVERYRLSAHADKKELLALVEKVQPRKLLLVHGATKARGELFKSVHKVCRAVDVRLPENGRSYLVKKRIGISRGRRFSNDRVSEIAAFVRKMERNGPFRVWELAEIWFGTEALTPVGVEFFKWCLSLESRFFERRAADVFFLRQIV
ncbi:MAG: MBL fold metallo-hydrolase, partial [Candidatus Poribacteria bacterium]|nr:MBL fold metallo-hydrolase [Candidatus Poribacteria bacterium]